MIQTNLIHSEEFWSPLHFILFTRRSLELYCLFMNIRFNNKAFCSPHVEHMFNTHMMCGVEQKNIKSFETGVLEINVPRAGTSRTINESMPHAPQIQAMISCSRIKSLAGRCPFLRQTHILRSLRNNFVLRRKQALK